MVCAAVIGTVVISIIIISSSSGTIIFATVICVLMTRRVDEVIAVVGCLVDEERCRLEACTGHFHLGLDLPQRSLRDQLLALDLVLDTLGRIGYEVHDHDDEEDHVLEADEEEETRRQYEVIDLRVLAGRERRVRLAEAAVEALDARAIGAHVRDVLGQRKIDVALERTIVGEVGLVDEARYELGRERDDDAVGDDP